MFKLLKVLILIWTLFCVVGYFYGVQNVSRSQSAGDIDESAANIGVAVGTGFWFFLWFFPTLILGVLALLAKPKATGSKAPDGSTLCPDCGKYYEGKPRYCPWCGSKIER
jgi:ABC-type long-subunit fatty acid transport system fused permease/ATPase subunit